MDGMDAMKVGASDNNNQDKNADYRLEEDGQKAEAGAVSAEKPTTDEIRELQTQIQALEGQVKEKESKYLYLYAEFENFRKRAAKERVDVVKFGWESTAREILQTVDNLERALAHVPEGTEPGFVAGLSLVLSEMKSTLQKQGVQAIESIGKNFDPEFHEAVGQEKSDSPAGTVLKELLQGYTLHGRLLRPARVVISQGE